MFRPRSSETPCNQGASTDDNVLQGSSRKRNEEAYKVQFARELEMLEAPSRVKADVVSPISAVPTYPIHF
jgi:hypothetical protein